jgi:polyketide-type polyunsaturated fatty acid synthase PfaA
MLAFILAKLSKVTAAAKVRGSFMVVTRQGGSIGFNSTDTSADLVQNDLVQGGLNGLVKTLSHEWDSVLCRAVDFSAKFAADKVAALVSDELLDANTELSEVGYDNEGRLTLVGVATDSYALTAGNSINADSVFLVSGGAKGVTAHCVIRIAQEHKSKFILLGRSVFSSDEPSWASGINDEAALKKAAMQALIAAGDKPTPVKVMQFIKPIFANREISQTLNAIKAAGGQAEYVASDVTDAASVQAAVNPLIAKFGQVTGIIHGAGVLADKFIEQKTLQDFEAVYSTKIDGLLSMLSVTKQSELKHLVLFSSAAGFYGNPGQSDYSIANDILNKTAYRFKALHPKAQVLSFNWGPWDGGMVTPELKRMFAARGVYIIPLDAGAQLLLSELSANDNRCPQILVGNDLSKDQDTNSSNAEGSAVKKPQVSRFSTGLTTVTVAKSLQATNNAFLEDHTFNGNQVLPTVCAIAWMSDAATAVYSEYQYIGFEDYQLFKGVIFDGSEASDYTIDLAPSEQSDEQGIVRVKVTVSSINDAGKPVFHYGASLLMVKGGIAGVKLSKSLAAITSEVTPAATALYDNGTLFHGESLQGISDIVHCDEQGLLLACQVPSIASVKQGQFPLSHNNIFANDLVYQAMLVWVRKQYGIGSLPTSTAAWTVYREVAQDELFYLELTVVEHNLDQRRGSKVVCDVKLIAQDMSLIAQVKSAQVRASKSLNAMFEKKVSEKK